MCSVVLYLLPFLFSRILNNLFQKYFSFRLVTKFSHANKQQQPNFHTHTNISEATANTAQEHIHLHPYPETDYNPEQPSASVTTVITYLLPLPVDRFIHRFSSTDYIGYLITLRGGKNQVPFMTYQVGHTEKIWPCREREREREAVGPFGPGPWSRGGAKIYSYLT
jgi:hypothetical protein